MTESALRQWVERTRADQTGGRTGLTTAEREELAQLRKENRELRTERDILRMLDAHGITCSMSRTGECYDNAVMEAFFSMLKMELADRFDGCGEATLQLFDYIEVFYNQRRRHSTIGYVSPAAFERAAAAHRESMIAVQERVVRGILQAAPRDDLRS